ncbi:hypothetical protein MAJ_08394, partial [Metarhizium majus ARSEF 297]
MRTELCGQYHEEFLGEQRLHWVFGRAGYQLAVNETLSNGSWRECHGLNNSTDANIVPVYPPPPKYDSTDDNDDNYSPPGDPSWHTQECVFGFGPAPATVIAEGFGVVVNTIDLDHVSDFARGLAVAIGARMRTDSGSPAELSRASGRQDEPKIVSA